MFLSLDVQPGQFLKEKLKKTLLILYGRQKYSNQSLVARDIIIIR